MTRADTLIVLILLWLILCGGLAARFAAAELHTTPCFEGAKRVNA